MEIAVLGLGNAGKSSFVHVINTGVFKENMMATVKRKRRTRVAAIADGRHMLILTLCSVLCCALSGGFQHAQGSEGQSGDQSLVSLCSATDSWRR